MTSNKRKKEKLASVTALLDGYYASLPKQERQASDLLATLVRTILSQNTTDRNSEKAYLNLRQRYPSWSELAKAPQRDIAAAIRSAGLAQAKSKTVKTVVTVLGDRRDLALASLRQMNDKDAEEMLLSFPGVGIKTARCVLLFGLGRDVFPIDTHIYRVLTRIGILPTKISREKAHRVIDPLIAKGKCYSLHVNLIRLGREICHPQRPACNRCPLRRLCAYAKATQKTDVQLR